MRVLLVEEVPGRERLALSFLHKALLERGHDVEFSNYWQLEPDVRRFEPHLVADNISDSPAHFLGHLALLGPGQRNVNLMWEQLPQPADIRRYRFDDVVQQRLVDGRLSWGRAFKSILCTLNPLMDPDRVRVTGSIKHAIHSFYRGLAPERFHDFYDISFGDYQKVVLVADSTMHASKDSEKLRAQRLADASPFGCRYVSPFLYELSLRQRNTRAATVRVVRELATRNPDVLFVIRLHPSKDPSFYAGSYLELLDLPNVESSTTGDITPLVFISDLVVSSRSGSLIDAFLLNTPGVNLQVRDDPIDHLYLVDSVSNEFGTKMYEDELVETGVERLFDLPPRSAHQERVAVQRFGVVGQQAYANVVTFLEETMDREPVSKRVPLATYLQRGISRRHHPARRHLRNLVRRLGIVRKPPAGLQDFEYARLFEILSESWNRDGSNLAGTRSSDPAPAAVDG